MLAHATNLVVR